MNKPHIGFSFFSIALILLISAFLLTLAGSENVQAQLLSDESQSGRSSEYKSSHPSSPYSGGHGAKSKDVKDCNEDPILGWNSCKYGPVREKRHPSGGWYAGEEFGASGRSASIKPGKSASAKGANKPSGDKTIMVVDVTPEGGCAFWNDSNGTKNCGKKRKTKCIVIDGKCYVSVHCNRIDDNKNCIYESERCDYIYKGKHCIQFP